MTKEISEEYVHLSNLSITNLLQCLEESNVKQNFKESISEKDYNLILKEMRNESTIIGMRDLHNWIKLVLISNCINFTKQQIKPREISLLDIAVGRGGDLAKWNKSDVKYVFGFDSNDKSINSTDQDNPGAIQRKIDFKGLKIEDVHFEVGDATTINQNNISEFKSKHSLKGFQIVSCQFGLHYFFKSEQSLRKVLSLVSDNLVSGGLFIGTTINGNNVKNLFKNISTKVYSSELFRIERKFPKRVVKEFGNEYTFTIFDTRDRSNYFNTMGVSTEYLVNFQVLEDLAKEYKLTPVKLNFFEDYKMGKTTKYTELKSNVMSFDTIYDLDK